MKCMLLVKAIRVTAGQKELLVVNYSTLGETALL